MAGEVNQTTELVLENWQLTVVWTEILTVGAVAFMRAEINSQLPVNFLSIARDISTMVLGAINAGHGHGIASFLRVHAASWPASYC